MSEYKQRCFWCDESEIYQKYHDQEWGVPVFDDYRLFEKVCLEGFQAGLSWLTVLRKRESFRLAFVDFNFEKIALFTEAEVESLLQDASLIRHRGKIQAVITNAKQAIQLKQEFGSLVNYFWQYKVDVSSRQDHTEQTLKQLTLSPESVALSKDLKRRGWSFVGPTTMYALIQAMGLVNDHQEGCWVRDHVQSIQQQAYRTWLSDKP